MRKKRIHPAFKNFIMTDAVKKWDEILRKTSKDEYGEEYGLHSGVCFSTSDTFCQIMENDLGIPCEIEMVETFIGNEKTKDLFTDYMKNDNPQGFFEHLEKINKEKGKENLTSDDPVLIGLGAGGQEDQFHFVINLPKHGEAIDLTIDRVKVPNGI